MQSNPRARKLLLSTGSRFAWATTPARTHPGGGSSSRQVTVFERLGGSENVLLGQHVAQQMHHLAVRNSRAGSQGRNWCRSRSDEGTTAQDYSNPDGVTTQRSGPAHSRGKPSAGAIRGGR